MAKKELAIEATDIDNPSDLPTQQPSATRQYEWIGPYFRTAVYVHPIGYLRPNALTDAEITELLRQHPKLEEFWKAV